MTAGNFLAVISLRESAIPTPKPPADRGQPVPKPYDHDRYRIVTTGGLPAMHASAGTILGSLYDRGRRRASDHIPDRDWAEIAASRGRVLSERYWGSYVGFAVSYGQIAIVRAPFGELGCFYCRTDDSLYLASDLASLLRAADRPRTIAADRVPRQIGWPEWRFGDTCLDGVKELRGGDRLTITGEEVALDHVWSPWPFIAQGRQLEDEAEAMRRLRDTVDLVIAARASEFRQPLLLLSGGLDSSIVASGLKAAGGRFSCLNLRADDAASDETGYARCVADAVATGLRIERLDATLVEVTRSGAAHLPYPVHRCFTQAQDAIAWETARDLGADAVFDGGGGDNVFFASRSIAMLADCLLTGGFGRRFWSTAEALGDLAQAGIPRLIVKAVRRAWWRTNLPLHPAADVFLSPALKSELRRDGRHEWLRPPSSALPGRAAHVSLMAPAQHMVEAVNAGSPYPAVSPLASQPVVEACLRIPSWLWIARGHDRAIARAAFRDRLPAVIIDRRSKGTPTNFVAGIYERNRTRIRDMLLGGWLADHGFLDSAALSRALADDGPVLDLEFAALMSLVDTEAWIGSQD